MTTFYDTELEEFLWDVEYCITAKARPTFFAIDHFQENAIKIVVSCRVFDVMSIQQRVSYVFQLLHHFFQERLENVLVVVSAFSGKEMEDVIDMTFEEFDEV